MAGSRAPSGSLRNHASTASKVSKGSVFGTQPSAPKVKKNTFTSDDSDSDSGSSSSSSDSDGGDMKKVKQTPLSSKKVDIAKSTPAKSPTVNGLYASIKKEQPSKKIKKETSSSGSSESGSGSGSSSGSGSESGSDSGSDGSSSDEESQKAPTKVEEAKKGTKPQTKPETKATAIGDSQSSSTSGNPIEKVKKSPTKADKKLETPSKSKAKAVKQATPSESESESESESGSGSGSGEGSAESGSESGSDSGSESGSESESDGESEQSEDPEAQIQQQLKDDVKSAKATKSKAPTSSSAEPSNKKIKTSQPTVLEDVDGDIEMTDQSTALTNGGASTKVGSVPEFVAPDFHLRKLDGSIGASDVAAFFEKSKTEGKQIWYITAPASLPVTVVQDLTIPLDSAQQGLPVLNHDGEDYRLAFDDPAAASSFRLLIPNKKGHEYSELGRPVDQTMHFTRSETFIPDGPSSMTTTQTVSKTTRPARPQPEGLRPRYTPLGVPASKKTLDTQASPQNKSVANAATPEAVVSTPRSSSKKKRKHDGENGPVATPTTKESSKRASAEKTAKKQKTNSRNNEHAADGPAGRKETPVPLPPQFSVGSSSGANFSRPRAASAAPPATQPLPISKRSASPGARLPSTQLPPKQTPIPIPVPAKVSSTASTPDAKPREGKKKKNNPKLPSVDQVAARFGEMAAARTPERSENSPRKSAKASKKNTPVLPPRHDSN